MGMVIYPEFDRDVKLPERKTTGEFLAQEFPALQMLAEERDLPGPIDFSDPREVPENFTGSPDELDELMGPCEDWFDPEAGAAAFRALAAWIRKDPAAGDYLQSPDMLVKELEDLADQLTAAARAGAGFRLELG